MASGASAGDRVSADSRVRDAEEFDRLRRRVLWALPTGLFVVGTRSGPTVNAMTASLVMQVATEPKLLAVAIEAGSRTRRLVEESGCFSVSVLDREQRSVVRRFVKPVEEIDRTDGAITALQGVPVVEVGDGLPVVAAAVAWLVCTSVRSILHDLVGGEPASHVLFVGEVTDAGAVEPVGRSVLRMEDTRMHYGG